jgi:hypothetical protein
MNRAGIRCAACLNASAPAMMKLDRLLSVAGWTSWPKVAGRLT